MYMNIVIIDKAMFAFQIAGAYRLKNDGIRIAAYVFEHSQFHSFKKLPFGNLAYFFCCYAYVFNHKKKFIYLWMSKNNLL